MNYPDILFNSKHKAVSSSDIKNKINKFPYKEASCEIISESRSLEIDGEVFLNCAYRILTNFGMTRSGVFKDLDKTHL